MPEGSDSDEQCGLTWTKMAQLAVAQPLPAASEGTQRHLKLPKAVLACMHQF